MPYDRTDRLANGFQRWLVRRGAHKVSWEHYKLANCWADLLKQRVGLDLFATA
jgi:hypothetical protein